MGRRARGRVTCLVQREDPYPRVMRAQHVVLLHGQPGSGRDWATVVARLDPAVVASALDRPGYGTNPLPPGDFVANARAMLAELDARGVARAVVIGHSFGGGIALAAAQLAPERIEGLVLISSVGPGCIDGWDRLLAAPVAGEICALAAWWLTPAFARARLARVVRLRDRPLDHDEQVNWQVWGEARHQHGAMWRTFLAEQRALVRSFRELEPGLGDISAATLVLADPADPLIPPATPRALAEVLPNGRLQWIEIGAHHLPRRAPEAVAAAINDFLSTLEPSR
ncbi:MAG: alpha/beta hydrolase fold protein [Acidimicrobiales bacterium]|nr:alpha/beta hydrolase fold protein [Acidimicrobiales bacterium]